MNKKKDFFKWVFKGQEILECYEQKEGNFKWVFIIQEILNDMNKKRDFWVTKLVFLVFLHVGIFHSRNLE